MLLPEQPDYILLRSQDQLDLNKAISGGIRTTTEINSWANQTVGEIALIVDRVLGLFNPHLEVLSDASCPNLRLILPNNAQSAANELLQRFSGEVDGVCR
jgi:hypothetical protein